MKRTPLKKTSSLKSRKRIKSIGKKTLSWIKTKQELTKKFQEKGIINCELCGTNNLLSFAHSKKRRNIKSQEELETVILVCQICHHSIEYLGSEQMESIVLETIKKRKPIDNLEV